MPAWEPILGADGVKEVANYVMSLSGKPHDANLASAGKAKFEANCVACHGADGKGMQALGAPNLTDNTWLYGGSEAAIMESISKGRNGTMPAQLDRLGAAKVHLLAAYVWGLGGGQQPAAAPAPEAAAPAAPAEGAAPEAAAPAVPAESAAK
jgi:cytochrome c oxidase cbb3-type subunit 3